jgi:hypothetical protein
MHFVTLYQYKLMKNNVGSKFFNIIQDMYDICQSAVKISNRHSEYFNVEMEVKQGVSFRTHSI